MSGSHAAETASRPQVRRDDAETAPGSGEARCRPAVGRGRREPAAGRNGPSRRRTSRGCRWRRGGCCSGFSTGFESTLVAIVFMQVESMHHPDGQGRSRRWLEELFRWRGGFRDEYVLTIPAPAHATTSSPVASLVTSEDPTGKADISVGSTGHADQVRLTKQPEHPSAELRSSCLKSVHMLSLNRSTRVPLR